jgi:diguanylate cyclase (GGDEF)-like protein
VILVVVITTMGAAWLPLEVRATPGSQSYWLTLPAIVAAWRFGFRGVVGAALFETAMAGPATDLLPTAAHPSFLQEAQQVLLLLVVGLVVAVLVRRIEAADALALKLLDEQRNAALAAASERGELSEKLQRRMNQDPLTGLSNRDGFLTALRAHLGLGGAVAVLFLDLDDFKTVNDTLGHAVGDELIGNVAKRLAGASRGEDVVARFGGDEFAVLLTGLTDQHALRVCHRLLAEFKTPFSLCGRTVTVRASAGLTTSLGLPTEGVERRAADLLRQADLAMYASKAQRTHGVTVYQEDMQTEMVDRLALESDLHHAVAGRDLHLVYQPIVDLASGKVRAVEALMRWQHPSGELVPPSLFVPVAEQNGMIVPLTLWALREGCSQLRAWDQNPVTRGLGLAVNISGRLIREAGIASAIAREIHASGGLPERLTLEITESLLMNERSNAVRTLCQLRALGCRLSVDDFGTGYSSLSRLHDLPIDEVKIDRSFVEQIDVREAGHAITAATVTMAHGLGLHVVAEGVETASQLQLLSRLGCDNGQGYLFGRPQPAELIAELVAACNAALADGVPRQAVSTDGAAQYLTGRDPGTLAQPHAAVALTQRSA